MDEIHEKNTMTLDDLQKNIRSMIPDLKLAAEKPAIENPFISKITLSKWDKINMVIFSLLIPIRLVLLLISVLLGGGMAKLFLLGYKESTPPEPLKGFRRIGIWLAYTLSRILAFILGFHHIKVKGKLSPDARIIVAAPHSSFVDTVVIAQIGRFSGVTRIENLNVPFIGNIIKLMQPIAVSRADRNSKMQVIKEIKRRAHSKEWQPSLLFAEGTCTNRKAFIYFKPGAFYPGLPVQPVVLRYKGALDCPSWTWMGSGALYILCIMTSRLYNNVEVEILPVYKPSQEEIDDPFIFARNVRDYIGMCEKMPVTDHSFEDCRLMEKAKKLNLPMEAGLVEYYKLSPMLGMNCDNMMECLERFAQIDHSKDGIIDLEEFCEYLHFPPTKELQTIFSIYDINQDNVINFREYLLGTFLISRPFNRDENMKAAFSLFDSQDKGFITRESFSDLIKKLMGLGDHYINIIYDELDSEKSGRASYKEFQVFCLNKPEYALLFIHFRKLYEDSSSMTYSKAQLQRSSSIADFEGLSSSSI